MSTIPSYSDRKQHVVEFVKGNQTTLHAFEALKYLYHWYKLERAYETSQRTIKTIQTHSGALAEMEKVVAFRNEIKDL